MEKACKIKSFIFKVVLQLALILGLESGTTAVKASSSVNFLPLATYSFSFGNPVNIIGGEDSAENKVFFILDKGDIFGGIPAKISAVNMNGAIVASLSSITNPTNFAFNSGILYVTDAGHVYEYSYNGSGFTQVSGTPYSLSASMVNPTGIAVDMSNDILLTYSGAVPIRKFDHVYKTFSIPGGFSGFSSPTAIAIAPDIVTNTGASYAYVADKTTNTVQVFDATTGSSIKSGSPASPVVFSGPTLPTGVAVNASGSQILISNGTQTQVLDYLGNLLGTISPSVSAGVSPDGFFVGVLNTSTISFLYNWPQFVNNGGETPVLSSLNLSSAGLLLNRASVSADTNTLVLYGGVSPSILKIAGALRLGGKKLQISGGTLNAGSLVLGGGIVNNTVPATISALDSTGGGIVQADADLTVTNLITLIDSMYKNGSGSLLASLDLSGKALTLEAGTIKSVKLNGGTLNTVSAATVTTLDITGGGILNTYADLTVTNPMALVGSITKSGAGALNLGGNTLAIGANTFQISGGSLKNGAITLAGGTIVDSASSGGTGIASNIDLAASTTNTFKVDTPTETMTLSGVISGAGSVSIPGPGTVAVTGVSPSYTGTATVSSSGVLIGTGTIAGSVVNSGTVSPGNGGVGTLTLGNYTQTGTLKIPISTDVGILKIDGTASLGGVLNLYPHGYLDLPDMRNMPFPILQTTGAISNFFSSGTLDTGFPSGYDFQISAPIPRTDIPGGYRVLLKIVSTPGASKITMPDFRTPWEKWVDDGGDMSLASLNLSTVGRLNRAGADADTLVIPASSTLTVSGTTDLATKTLKLAGGSLTAGAINVDGGTLEDASTGSPTLSAAIALPSATNTLAVDTAGETLTLSGNTSGAGGLTKTGPGSLKLTGAIGHMGSTTVNAGTLFVQPGTIASPVVLNAGGTVSGASGSTRFHDLTFNGGALGAGSFGFDVDATVTTLANATFPSALTLIGNLTKAGSKTLTVTGIDLGAYTLSVGEGAISGPITVSQSTANLILSGGSVSQIALNGGSLTVTSSTGLSSNFSVDGSAAITVASGQSLTLPAFSIGGSGSVLSINGAGTVSIGGSGTTVGAGKKLALSGGGALSGTIRLGGGSLSLESGDYNLSANLLNLSGGDTVNVTNAASTLTLHTFTVAASRAFNIAGAGTVNVPNGITATGNLTVGSLTAHGVKVTGGMIVNTGSLANYGNIAVWIKNNTGGTATLYDGSTTTGVTLNAGVVKLSKGATLSNIAFAGGTLEVLGDNTLSGFSNTASSTIQIDDGATLTAPCFTVGLSSKSEQATGITLNQKGAGTLNVPSGFIIPANTSYTLQAGKITGQMISNSGTLTSSGDIEVWIKNISGGKVNLNSGSTTLGVTLSAGNLYLNEGATLNALALNGGLLEVTGDHTISDFTNAASASVQVDGTSTLTASSFTVGKTSAGVQNTGVLLKKLGAGALAAPTITIGTGNTFELDAGSVSGTLVLGGGTFNNTIAATVISLDTTGGGTVKTDKDLTVTNAIKLLGDVTKSGTADLIASLDLAGKQLTITGGSVSNIKLNGGTFNNTVATTLDAVDTVGGGTIQADGLLSISGVLDIGSNALKLTGTGGIKAASVMMGANGSLHNTVATTLTATGAAKTISLQGTVTTDDVFTLSGTTALIGALTKTGASNLVVPSSGLDLAGNTLTVSAGTMSGLLKLKAGTLTTADSLDLSGIIPDVSGGGTLDLGADLAGKLLTLASATTLQGDLLKTGAGTLDLGGKTLTVGANTLEIDAGSISNGTISLKGTSDGVIGTLLDSSVSGKLSIAADIGLNYAYNNIDVARSDAILELTGDISGDSIGVAADGFTKVGLGKLVLNPDPGKTISYKGPTTITAGTLTYQINPSSGSVFVQPTSGLKAILDIETSNTFKLPITLDGTHGSAKVVGVDGTTLSGILRLTGLDNTLSPSGSMTLSGGTGGDGDLILDGSGQLILQAASAHTGTTKVVRGTLEYQAEPTDGSVLLQPSQGATTWLSLNYGDLGDPINFTRPLELDSSASGSTTGITVTDSINPTLTQSVTLKGLNNTVTVPTQSTMTLAAALSGTGRLTKAGDGALTVEQTDDVTQPLILQAGSLNTTQNPKFMDVTFAGGTLGTGAFTFGSSSLPATITTLVDTLLPNRVSFAGATTFTGDHKLTIPAQTLTAPVTLVGGTVSWTPGTLTLKDLTLSGGAIDPDAGTLTLAQGVVVRTTPPNTGWASPEIKNAVALTGNTTFDVGDRTSLVLSGNMEGTGPVTIQGSGYGSMFMSGTNTYTGITTIGGSSANSGSLVLTGSLRGDVSVNSGGSLSGSGTIHGNVTNAGSVMPDTDSLKVGRTYTQASSGTLGILVGKSNDQIVSSLLDVTGSVALSAGSKVAFVPHWESALDPTDASLTGETFPIVRSGGEITGFFTQGSVADSMRGFDFQVVGPKDVDGKQTIQVILHPLSSSTALSSVTLSPTVVTQTTTTISSQISKSQDKFDFDTMNKSFGGKGDNPVEDEFFRARTIPVSSTKAGSLFRNTSGQRYQAPRGWENLFSILDQTGSLNMSKDDTDAGKIDKTFWISPLYSNGTNKKTTSSGASRDHMQLLLAGMEWQNPKTKQLFGISLGGGFGEAKSSVLRGNKSDHKTIQAALYHSMRWDEIRWDVFANANRMFSHNDRVANASTGYIIKSSNTTDTLGASTEISYKGNLGDLLVVRPYYGLDTWYTVAHGYREKDNSIYSQAHAKMSGTGFDHYIGASIRKTWMGIGQYSLRLEGDLWYSYILKDSTMTDRITAVENNALIRSTPIAGYGKGTFGPSLTASAMNQETGTKYFISGSATVQDKRTAYQLLLKAAVPLN